MHLFACCLDLSGGWSHAGAALRYEFNPNSEILDPNLDQCCKGPWTNVTQTLPRA